MLQRAVTHKVHPNRWHIIIIGNNLVLCTELWGLHIFAMEHLSVSEKVNNPKGVAAKKLNELSPVALQSIECFIIGAFLRFENL